jgi:hypothetical protein
MKRSQLRNIIAEELQNLTNEAVPSNIQSFVNRKGATAKKLVKQVDTWARKMGKHIVGGTAIGKYYDTIILDLTYSQGSEVYINLDSETIKVNGEPVTNFKEFEMAVMNLTNESKSLSEDFGEFGDAYSTKNVSREDLNQLIDMLDAVDISYDLDGRGETIEFDMTELDRRQQQQVKKWLNVNESKMQEKKEQQAVYMAPAGRASLKKHNGKVATILSDTDGMYTIQFPDGTQLTEVPAAQLRFVRNEGITEAKDFNVNDLPLGAIITFRDGETWKVTKIIGNSSNPRGYLMAPSGKTKEHYISMQIEFTVKKLLDDAVAVN